MYASIVFMDDTEGAEVTDILCHVEGSVVHGATYPRIMAVIEHLAQWDTGEYSSIHAEPHHGSRDSTYRMDGYLLSWNAALGYVGLEVEVAPDDPEHVDPWAQFSAVDVATCRGCEQPVDYCLDHTHVPDELTDDYVREYDAATAALTAL